MSVKGSETCNKSYKLLQHCIHIYNLNCQNWWPTLDQFTTFQSILNTLNYKKNLLFLKYVIFSSMQLWYTTGECYGVHVHSTHWWVYSAHTCYTILNCLFEPWDHKLYYILQHQIWSHVAVIFIIHYYQFFKIFKVLLKSSIFII